jgi:hypothetical protein
MEVARLMTSAFAELTEVMRDARALVARPGNDFACSSWRDSAHSLAEIDALTALLEAGQRPKRLTLEVLFAPTGPSRK